MVLLLDARNRLIDPPPKLLCDEIAAYMRAPETVKQFTATGREVDIQNTEAVRGFIPAEIAKWRKVAIDAKMPRETL